MITKEKKREVVATLVEKISQATSLYFVDFTGMSVAMDYKFRGELKGKDVTIQVAKNTLILRALAEVGGYEVQESQLFGQTALIFGASDPIAPAKIIKQFFDKGQKPALKLAIIEGQMYDGSQLKQVAELPTREELISQIIGSVHAPISGIVGSVGAVMRDVAMLVEEVAKKQAA